MNDVSRTTTSYDHDLSRILLSTATSTTIYPSKYYSIVSSVVGTTTTATSTHYIYTGDTLVAYTETRLINGTATGTPQTYYVHPDHLNSTNVVTDQQGSAVMVKDYYPYGQERVSDTTASLSRGYIGQYTDPSGLDYLNARYYNPQQGQFLSEDPSHLAVGDSAQVQKITGQSQQTYLMDPQALNSYSYARDNPIVRSDATGRAFVIDDALGFVGGGVVGSGVYLLNSLASQQTLTSSEAAGAFVTGGIIGWGAVNTPETLGASNVISASIVTGLIGGYYGNLTKQGIDVATGKQSGINYTEAQTNGLVTAGTNGVLQGILPNTKISGVTSGPNSMTAITKSNLTKAANGTINNISVNSAIKSAISSQSSDLYRTFMGGIIDTAKSISTSNKKNK